MLNRFGVVFIGCLLAAGTAWAEEHDGAFDELSTGNQKIVSALDSFQEPPVTDPETDPLTKDQIAVLKADTGWGNVFKQLKADGFFDDFKNLGQVISSFNHQRLGLHEDGPGRSGTHTATLSAKKVHKAKFSASRPHRPMRIRRFHRPKRPHRPNR